MGASVTWNAWGITWGDSWGDSWGPLHTVEVDYGWDTSQGVAGKNKPPQKDYLSENLLRQQKAREQNLTPQYNLTRLHAEDALVTEVLIAFITKGFANVQGHNVLQ